MLSAVRRLHRLLGVLVQLLRIGENHHHSISCKYHMPALTAAAPPKRYNLQCEGGSRPYLGSGSTGAVSSPPLPSPFTSIFSSYNKVTLAPTPFLSRTTSQAAKAKTAVLIVRARGCWPKTRRVYHQAPALCGVVPAYYILFYHVRLIVSTGTMAVAKEEGRWNLVIIVFGILCNNMYV